MNEKVIQIVENTILRLCWIINFFIPKDKNTIFLYSMPDYTDNAREIYKELVRQELDKKYRVVWSVRDVEKHGKTIENAIVVRHRSIRSFILYCRSHYIFRTHSLWGNLYIRNRQKMFVAFHGMPIKSLTEGDPKPFKCDYINTTSDFFKEHLYKTVARPYKANENVGLARNDLLFRDNTIIQEMGFDHYKKIYLWMPTFRNSRYSTFSDGKESETCLPLVSFSDLNTINKILHKKNELLLIRLHPWSLDKLGQITLSNIRIMTEKEIPKGHTLYELLGKIDVLITDYSSVSVDFLLTNKPMWFVYDDLEEYRKTRGFVVEPIEDYLPGQKIHDKMQLIRSFDSDYDDTDYKKKRQEIKDLFFQYEDDHSAKRALKVMGIA